MYSAKYILRAFIFFSWIVFLLSSAFFAEFFLSYQPSFPYANELNRFDLPRVIQSFANFDGVHYLTIVEKGYHGTGLIQAFFPLYPLLIWILSLLTTNELIAGLIISAASLLASLYLFEKLIGIDHGESAIQYANSILLFFPTSFFFLGLYSESLFFMLVIASFLSARKSYWWLAGILAALASATRLVGIFLLPALLLELYIQVSESITASSWQRKIRQTIYAILRDKPLALLTISLSATGLLSYMIFLNSVFHDPLYFFHVQSEFGGGRQESIILLPQVIFRYIKIFLTFEPWNLKFFAIVQEFVLSIFALLILIINYKNIRSSYLLFSLLAFILPTLTGTLSSMPRYILVCFPIYMILGEYFVFRPHKRLLYFAIAGFLLMLNTMLFVQGYWVA